MVGQHPHRRPYGNDDAHNDPDYGYGPEGSDDPRIDDDGAGLPVVFRDQAWDEEDDRPTIAGWPVVIPPDPPEDLTPVFRRRFGAYAAGIAVAAVLGGIAGALAVASLGEGRGGGADADETVVALRTSIGQLATEIRSLKTGIGADSEATAKGLAAVEARVAGAERAQTALSAKIADLSVPAAAAGPALPPGVSGEITGSLGTLPLPVVNDWILWRVRNGRALVQGGGGYFEIVPGSSLPGLGMVDRIAHEDGRWVVFTERGVILGRG